MTCLGMGKTLQIIAFLRCLKQKKKFNIALAVLPNSLGPMWINEIERWCKNDMAIQDLD